MIGRFTLGVRVSISLRLILMIERVTVRLGRKTIGDRSKVKIPRVNLALPRA